MAVRIAVVTAFLTACSGPGLAPGSEPPPSRAPAATASTVSAATMSASPTASPAVSPAATETGTPPPMPAGLPVHDSMQPIEPEQGRTAAWETQAVPQEIYNFYIDELPKAGFVIDLAAPGGDAAILRFTSPEGVAYQLDLTGHFPMEVALGPPHD